MRRGHAYAALCACSLLLAACGRQDAPAPEPDSTLAPVTPVTPAQPRFSIQGRVHPNLPEMTFSAIGQTADGVLRVQSIEIQRAGDAASLQRIDGLATETPWSDASPGLELIDMNFDDHADLRLIEARPAGPNVPYLNWLYDPASGRFVANALLDSLGAPTFDAAAREIRSEWRDSAARYGTDTYGVRDGQPVPSKREARNYAKPGVYTLEVSTWSDGAWKLVDTRPERDR